MAIFQGHARWRQLYGQVEDCASGILEHCCAPFLRVRRERNTPMTDHQLEAVQLQVSGLCLDEQATLYQMLQYTPLH
jgi:hypothetical protein